MKILECHFSYNKTLQQENNIEKYPKQISQLENVLKVWRIRYLTLKWKINGFRSLAISKVIHLALVIHISTDIINLLNTIQKNFLRKGKYARIKHESLCTNYEQNVLRYRNYMTKIFTNGESYHLICLKLLSAIFYYF